MRAKGSILAFSRSCVSGRYLLDDVEAAEDSRVEVALPGLDVVVGVVAEAGEVGGGGAVVLHEGPEEGCLPAEVLKMTMPLAKLYFSAFSLGNDSTSTFGSSDSLTDTAGGLLTCFFESTSS